MKKSDWTLVIGCVLIVWFIDFATKSAIINSLNQLPHWFKWGGFVFHKNPGAMLGAYSDLPPILRIVSFATGGAFLVFIYAIVQYFLPIKALPLRLGLSFLLGGILGNVIDRIRFGYVVDFIVLGNKDIGLSPVFNLADSLQWVGYILVVYSLFKYGEELWPTHNARKKLWINPKYQIKYCLTITSVSLWFALILGVFSYTFIKVIFDEFNFQTVTPEIQKHYISSFLSIFIIWTLIFSTSLFLIGRFLSHRSAGPILAFENFISDLRSGKPRPLKLRQHDEFKNLEEVAKDLLSDYSNGITQTSISEETPKVLFK